MLILTKRKDYYDGVAGTMGIDKTIVFDRQVVELSENKFPEIFKRKNFSFGKDNIKRFCSLTTHSIKPEYKKKFKDYDYFIVGFCGKLYIGWKLYSEIINTFGSSDMITTITYDFDILKNLIQPRTYGGNIVDDVNYILKYDSLYLFRELNTPIFVYDYNTSTASYARYYKREEKFIINPNLSDYEFYQVIDSFQAFQEIQMFLSGVLGNKEKDIVVVEDKYKITQHGFDKWSFRKEPKNNK